VAVGTATAAVVRAGTGVALTARGLVEVETDSGLAPSFSVWILIRANLGWVVRARAHRTTWLSKTGEGHSPKFKVDFEN